MKEKLNKFHSLLVSENVVEKVGRSRRGVKFRLLLLCQLTRPWMCLFFALTRVPCDFLRLHFYLFSLSFHSAMFLMSSFIPHLDRRRIPVVLSSQVTKQQITFFCFHIIKAFTRLCSYAPLRCVTHSIFNKMRIFISHFSFIPCHTIRPIFPSTFLTLPLIAENFNFNGRPTERPRMATTNSWENCY